MSYPGPALIATVREELEISLGWARENPALFVKAIDEWAVKHPADWSHRVDFRRGNFMTLIATAPA